jgi:hypothetical protein
MQKSILKITITIFFISALQSCSTIKKEIKKPLSKNNSQIYYNNQLCAEGDTISHERTGVWYFYNMIDGAYQKKYLIYDYNTKKIIFRDSKNTISQIDTIKFRDEQDKALSKPPIFPYGGNGAINYIIDKNIVYKNLDREQTICRLRIYVEVVIAKTGNPHFTIVKYSGKDECGFIKEAQRILDNLKLEWIPAQNGQKDNISSKGLLILNFRLE